jgi:hypothetical protein
MADTQAVTLNSDGSAEVNCRFDPTGTTLPPEYVNNSTTYSLPVPQPTTDGSGNPVAAVPWTEESAIAATTAQAAIDKANWVAALEAAEE